MCFLVQHVTRWKVFIQATPGELKNAMCRQEEGVYAALCHVIMYKVLFERVVLGRPQAREELTDTMCRKEMGVYTAIFSTTGDTAALERTDRRYLWLRKRLAARKEVRLASNSPPPPRRLLCFVLQHNSSMTC